MADPTMIETTGDPLRVPTMKAKPSVRRAIEIFCIAFGLLFLALIGFEQYKLLKVLTVAFLLLPLAYLSVVYPESVIWMCLMLYLTPGAEMLGNALLVFLGIVLVSHRFLVKREKIGRDLVLYLWGVIALNAAITVKNWYDIGKAIRGSIHFLFLPILLYLGIAKGLISEKGCQRLWRTYLPIAISYAIIQVSFALATGLSAFEHKVMLAHTGINLGWGYSNTLAAIMVLFAAVIISHPGFTKGGTVQRLWFYFVTFIAIATPFIIISKGAILSFILGVLSFVIILSILQGRVRIGGWLIYIGIFLLLTISIFYSYFATLIQRYQNLRIDVATYGRLHLIFDSLSAMRRNHLIGTGPNQHLYSEFYRYLEDPHNIFLRYGVDIGVASLVAIMIILGYPLYLLFIKRKREPQKVLALYSAFMLPYFVAIFNSQVEAAITKYHYGIVFWIFYGMVIRYASRDGNALGIEDRRDIK